MSEQLSSDIAFADISQIAQQLRSSQITSVTLTDTMLERIKTHDATLNAFITVTADHARAAAAKADHELAVGHDRGPLHGVPIAVKDLFALRGARNTFGTLLYQDHVPNIDSTIVEKLNKAGAVIVGKTNLHEFATGTTSINPHYGAVRNPWDTNCYAGGSSGGSAAAVAAGLAYGAIGTDTGCSIRQPAHMCGLAGLKPTFGRISKYGGWALSWSMDHAGPLTRTVRDCAIMTQLLAGYDARDPGSANQPVDDMISGLDKGIAGSRIGIARDYFLDNCAEDVAKGFEDAVQVLRDLGAHVEEVNLPDMHAARAAGHTIIFTEFHALYHEAAQRQPEKFSDINRAFVELGGLFTANQLLQAQRVRRLITEQTLTAMNGFDAIIMPTCPVTTAAIDALTGSEPIYHTQNTIPFDTISLPALSVPAGFDRQDRPFGLQIVGKPFDEAGVLRIGYAYEQASRWFERRPSDFLAHSI